MVLGQHDRQGLFRSRGLHARTGCRFRPLRLSGVSRFLQCQPSGEVEYASQALLAFDPHFAAHQFNKGF